MRLYRRWWHTKYDMKCHFIFFPKYRKRVLYGKISKKLREIIKFECTRLNVKIISGKLSVDHVHLFVSYPVKLSGSQIMKSVKGWSSRKIMKEFPFIRKKYYRWWNFRARWYMAVSSWSITDEMIQEYIDNQEWEEIQWEIEME
jgi:putative transposase